MNALGISLVWMALQVSLFCLAGAGAYFVAQRRQPGWAPSVLCGVLVATVGIATLSLSPWPRWWTVANVRPAAPGAATADPPQTPLGQPSPAADGATDGPADATPSEIHVGLHNFLSGIWGKVQGELVQESSADHRARQRRWPAWLAIAIVSGMGIGLARVLLGWVALAGLLRDTRPLTDPSLVCLLEQLRAQLRCRRSIELREMPAAGGSPAVVGWRRPVILLPADWRLWSTDARRGILAHETAHVAHGDVLMWLAAQSGVIVHFYNPLAHWLALRLRLEQELAADARGAALAGGSKAYATLLARMALQQDEPRPLWAGRPFFPTRGTLMRRIEMLQNQHFATTARSSSRIAAAALVTTLVLVGLGVAGLRGPTSAARADEPAPETKSAAAASVDANDGVLPAFDNSYLPADTIAVTSIKPLQVAKSTVAVAPVFLVAPNMAGFGFLPEEKGKVRPWYVEEIKMIMLRPKPSQVSQSPPAASEDPPMVVIYRLRHPYERSKLRDTISWEAANRVTETVLNGHPCFRAVCEVGGDPINYLMTNDRTIVVVRQRDVASVLAADSQSHPSWYDRWQQVAESPIAVAFDSAATVALEKDPTDAADNLFVSVLQQTELIFGHVECTPDGVRFSATAHCKSSEQAAATTQVAKSGVATAMMAVPQLLQPSLLPEEYRAIDMSGPLLRTLSNLSVNARRARVDVEAKLDADFVAQLVEATKAYNDARSKSDEQAHITKLGRLAKAFQAYHAAHGHYPPAAVVGPDGKNLHSWRVELLPYLGEQKLFDEYKFDEPWDGEHNKPLIAKIPNIYSTSPWSEKGDADYFVVTGRGTLFDADALPKHESITDAPGKTILVLQSRQRVPWTKPVDIDNSAGDDPGRPVRGLEHGFHAAFADGTVKFVPEATDVPTVRAMFTKAGGDEVKLR